MIPKSIYIDCSQKCPRKKTKSNENLHNGHLNTSSALCFPLSHYFLFVDKNECLNNKGHCSQYCFNERGSYRCGCRIGYTLEENGRYCKGTDFLWRLVLLETNQNEKKTGYHLRTMISTILIYMPSIKHRNSVDKVISVKLLSTCVESKNNHCI